MKVDCSCRSNYNGFAVFFIVVLMSCSSSAAAARGLLLFTNKPSSALVDLTGDESIQYIHHHDAAAAASTTDFSQLMGGVLEECGDEKDEECEKRRMVAEAHLDYIYTQNHKNP